MSSNGDTLFLDREEERKILGRLVTDEDSIRVVTICAPEKCGKSALVGWYEQQAQQKFHLPTGGVELDDEMDDKSPFGLVEELVPQLKNFGLTFEAFQYYDDARTDHDWSEFRPKRPAGFTDLRGTQISGGVQAGSVETVYQLQTDQATIVERSREWSGQHEQKARDRCADAFLEDLRELSREKRVMILIDAYENCPPELAGWVKNRLLFNHVLVDQPTQLTVVLAGRPAPHFPQDMMDGRDRVETLVELSTWEDVHITEYLEDKGIPVTDNTLGMVREGLHDHGWTFEELKSFEKAFPRARTPARLSTGRF